MSRFVNFFFDISDIAKFVEKQFYTDKEWHFKYDVAAMIKLEIVKFFLQQPYKYGFAFEDFEKQIKPAIREDFEQWDDYIEWKVYHKSYHYWKSFHGESSQWM